MTEAQTKLNKQNKIILFLMAIIFAIFFVSAPINLLVNAESNRVTSVIEDLQTDPNFSVDAYPSDSKDYSLKVIQIAETTAKELLIYVYQPSAVTTELRATSINISTSIGDNFAPKNYDLTFLNSRGVFQKYVVNDFYVKNDALRYYDIISIFRAWNEDLDNKPGADQTISERSYEVGQLWTACTINGEVSYSNSESETIEIIDKYVGFIRYNNGFIFYSSACDSHYVAFSTDMVMERLLQVDLKYTYRTVEARDNLTGLHPNYTSDPTTVDKRLKADNIASNDHTGQGFFKYSWKRIEKAQDFIEDKDLSAEAKAKIKTKQWVLSFAETEYQQRAYSGYTGHYYTEVSEVTILTLKFETDGKVYNLGVVDNKQTGSGIPDNNSNKSWWQEMWNLIMTGLTYIGYAIILIIVIKIVKEVIDLIKTLFKRRK